MQTKRQSLSSFLATNAWGKTFVYYAGFIALGLTTASLGPTLPDLAKNTASDISNISFLFVVRSLGYLLGSINSGRIYDKRPGNPIMSLGLAVIAVLLILVPIIPSLVILALVLLLVGFAEGTVDVGGNTLLLWLHQDRVAPFMNGLHFTFGIGALLTPLIVAQALSLTGGIKWAYWVLAILIFPIAFWLSRAPSPAHQISENKQNTKIARPGLIILMVLFFFLYVGGEAGYGGWVYTYTISIGLGTETSAAYLTSLFWGALTAGRFVAIPIASRLRPAIILTIDLIGCLFSIGAILMFPTSSEALWIGTIGAGVFMASIFPTMINLAQEKLTVTGKVTSWFFVGASSGGMLLPWIVGQFFEPIGPQTVMVAIFASLAAAFLVLGSIILNNKKHQLSPTPVE
jgi:FHS family Na+ dependent glucose MFS transporter 1